MTKLIRSAITLGAISNVADAFTRPLGDFGGASDASRGNFLDALREVAREQNGLNLRGPVGPIAVGRCADRLTNQCCAGSSWDCQAPGSTCSCDQMCVKYGDCCPDYQDVCGGAFDDLCHRKGSVESPDDDNSSSLTSQPIMFDDVGSLDIVAPVLLGAGTGRANGDPHYHTYDGDVVHFQGACTYQLTGLCPGSLGTEVDGVQLQNFKVYGKNKQRIKLSKNDILRPMAWIQDVIVEIPTIDSNIYVIMADDLAELTVNYVYNDGNTFSQEVTVADLPFQIRDSEGKSVALLYQRNNYIRLQLGSDGLTIGYNGRASFKIHLPCEYNGNVCGLLGNADNDPSNDNIMSNGEVASSSNELGDSWLFNSFPNFLGINTEECESQQITTPPETECPATDLREAATVCTQIIDQNGPFAQCHDVLPPADYFEDCVYDTCLFIVNDFDTSDTKCQSFAEYANDCRDKGIDIDWREDAQCTMDCPAHQTYQFNHGHTEETCEGFRQVAAEGQTTEGCFCDFGYVKSGDQCIEISKCFSHCPLENGFNLAVNSEYISSDCGKKCTCEPNYADSTLPPVTRCSESSCAFSEHCIDHGTFGMCEAIQFNSQFGSLDSDFGGFDSGNINFLGEDPLACLKKEEDVIVNHQHHGGAPSRASAVWLKPDACCGDKPYNTGEKGCCNDQLFDFDIEFCQEGQIVQF